MKKCEEKRLIYHVWSPDSGKVYLNSDYEAYVVDLASVVLDLSRSSKIDPYYQSTDNWKTEEQWKKLGFVLTPDSFDRAVVFGGLICGYTSSACKVTCVRIHRSFMRRVAK